MNLTDTENIGFRTITYKIEEKDARSDNEAGHQKKVALNVAKLSDEGQVLEKLDINLCNCQLDESIFRIIAELLYSKSKIALIDEDVEDIHKQAVKNVVDVLESMDAELNPLQIKKYLDDSRNVIHGDEKGKNVSTTE